MTHAVFYRPLNLSIVIGLSCPMYNTASLLPYLPELLILLPSGVCRPPAKEPSLVLGSPLKDDSMRQSVMNIKGRGGRHRWGGDE